MEHPQPVLGPQHPGVVRELGPALGTLAQFADLLSDDGVRRGLIGPRETPRLWERHLLNCAALAALLPQTGTVLDLGSGAGLPGVVLAAVRPELDVMLVEPMERRVIWLREVVEALGLTRTQVVRARAEDLHGKVEADVVTARAVAPMVRLVPWALPLVRVGGALLAMKGARAAEELVEAADEVVRCGGGPAEVVAATGPGGVETTVVRVVRVGEGRASGRRATGRSRH